MAPNRQSIACVLRSLSTEDLAGFVSQSKYAPLTAAATAEATPTAAPAAAAAAERSDEDGTHDESVQAQLDTKTSSSSAAASSPIHYDAEPENCWDEVSEDENDAAIPSDDYWSFPNVSADLDSEIAAAEAAERREEEDRVWKEEFARREALLATILMEEEARSAVSLGTIEAGLAKDAQRRTKEEADGCVAVVRNTEATDGDMEGYWDWDAENDTPVEEFTFCAAHIEDLIKSEAARLSSPPSDRPVTVTVQTSKSTNYWQWDTLTPHQAKARLIDGILADERARLLLSASHIQANLSNDTASTATQVVHSEEKADDNESYWFFPCEEEIVRAPHLEDPSHPANSYWDWTPPLSQQESRQVVIANILEDEKARQALTVSHIEDNLLDSSSAAPSVAVVHAESKEDDDSYWTWDTPSQQVRAPHTLDPSHPSNKYWDWSPSVSDEDSRRTMIDRILEDEEARRAVSSDRIAKVLEASASRKVVGDMCFGEEKEAENYWDM